MNRTRQTSCLEFPFGVVWSSAFRRCSKQLQTGTPNLQTSLLIRKGCDLLSEIIGAFFQPFAHLVTGEAPNTDLFAGLGRDLLDQIAYGQSLILDERLFEQRDLGEELLHSTVDHFINDVRRLIGVFRLSHRLTASDLALLLDDFGRNL